MPTFAFNDEDDIAQENEGYFRRFLGSSMEFFRTKKFLTVHQVEVQRKQQEKEEEATHKREVIRRFEERKEKHQAAFRSKKTTEPLRQTQCTEAAVHDMSQLWLEEYNHPSSTANISVHETLKADDIFDTSSLSISQDSVFNTSNTSALNISQPIFSTSVLVGGGASRPSLSGDKAIFGKLNTDKLDMFSGARPSFAAVTSTPVAKMFPSVSQKKEEVLEVKPSVKIESKAKEPEPSLKPIFEMSSRKESGSNENEPVKKVEVQTEAKSSPILQRRRSSGVPATPTTLISLYLQDIDKKDYNDMAKDRFEKSGNVLRVLIKRTVNERIALCSKRLATEKDILGAVIFFIKLVTGLEVESHSGERMIVNEPDALAYTYDVIINYCLGILERDNSLLTVLARILHGICDKSLNFESVLIGHLFSTSQLLRLDPDAAESFVQSLKTNPERRTAIVNREKNIVRVFIALHVVDVVSGSSRLNMRNLWRTMAITMNTPPRVLSTVLILISILEICPEKMKTVYGDQWQKLRRTLHDKLLPLLESNLLMSTLSQSAGEATFISVLRNELENL